MQSNNTYSLLGEKEDGTIEKVNNIMNLRPHMANVVRADGEFVPTKMETGFMIRGQNNDVGFGITTAPNGIPKITYMRGIGTENPIGYNIKDTTSYKQDVNDRIKNIFDVRSYDKQDIQEISDGIDKLDETPEEDRLNVKDFEDDIGEYYDDIAAEYNVSYEDVQRIDEELVKEGYYNADTRIEIIKQTLEEEKEEVEELVEEIEEENEQINEETVEEIEEEYKIDHGEREIEPPEPHNPYQPRE